VEIGDRQQIEGVLHECVSIGLFDEETGDYTMQEGRVPGEGEEGILIAPDSDPDRAYWMQPASEVDDRNRQSSLEMQMDALMPDVRRELLRFEDDGVVPLDVAAGLARAACAYGYEYGINEEPRGALKSSLQSPGNEG
jgi:hypothetical protein